MAAEGKKLRGVSGVWFVVFFLLLLLFLLLLNSVRCFQFRWYAQNPHCITVHCWTWHFCLVIECVSLLWCAMCFNFHTSFVLSCCFCFSFFLRVNPVNNQKKYVTHFDIFHRITNHIVRIHNDKKWKQTLHLFCRLRKTQQQIQIPRAAETQRIFTLSLVQKKSCVWCWFLFFFFSFLLSFH